MLYKIKNQEKKRLMTKVFAYGEKTGKGTYVWIFPILGLYGLFSSTITSRRYFVSRKLRKCFKKAVIDLEQHNIHLPAYMTENIKIIKKLEK